MAAVPLNKFLTIRHEVTDSVVGIYTCPIGVAGIVILSQVINISDGISTISAFHSRNTEPTIDFTLANQVVIPPYDSFNIISDGRLALETNDVIKIQGSSDGELQVVLTVLESAKQ